MSNFKHFHGLDVGGTKIEIVSFDAHFHPCHRQRVATPVDDFEQFLDAMAHLIEDADARMGSRGAVGVGMPGIIRMPSRQQFCSNLPAVCGHDVGALLSQRLGRPVALAKDSACFALSECHGGAADGAGTAFGVILGTGASGGFCAQGGLLDGAAGVGGEWGHGPISAVLVAKYGLPLWSCGCGLTACLERYVSGSGLAALHTHLTGQTAAAPAIVQDANLGRAEALKTLHIHADILASALANIVLLIDPQVIVLGGGLSQLDYLYDVLPKRMGAYLFEGTQPPPIRKPRFGDAGGSRGAAMWASQVLSAPAG